MTVSKALCTVSDDELFVTVYTGCSETHSVCTVSDDELFVNVYTGCSEHILCVLSVMTSCLSMYIQGVVKQILCVPSVMTICLSMYIQGVVKQILPLSMFDGDGSDIVTGLDVCSSFLLVTSVFNVLYLYDLSRRSYMQMILC